jgi:putative ABC transport system permease protein
VVHLRFGPTGTLTTAERDDPVLGPLISLTADGAPLLITTAAVEPRLPQLSSGHTAVLLFGGADPAALHAVAGRVLGPLAQVTVRTEALAALRADGLAQGVGVLYTASTLLAVLFALLAVALELVLTAPERGRTTSYLRALGLTGRGAAALHLVQLLPLVPIAALGGVVLGLVEPRFLGPALDLRAFTGGPGRPALHTDPALTVALGLGAALLVLAAAVLETLLARTRTLAAQIG